MDQIEQRRGIDTRHVGDGRYERREVEVEAAVDALSSVALRGSLQPSAPNASSSPLREKASTSDQVSGLGTPDSDSPSPARDQTVVGEPPSG